MKSGMVLIGMSVKMFSVMTSTRAGNSNRGHRIGLGGNGLEDAALPAIRSESLPWARERA
jgi:hypothetical protein